MVVVFAIHSHESAMGVHVFPILNPASHLPSYPIPRPSQCTSPEHPVSCIKPGLAIAIFNLCNNLERKSFAHCILQIGKKLRVVN